MENNSITKSNALIESGYRLSLTEMQIVLYGISLINPIGKNFPLTYRIDIKRFAELFNRDHGDIYGEVKKAILAKFWERDFSYKDEKGDIVTNRWLTQVKHQDKKGFIQIRFSEEVQPYLHQLKSHFTTYYIEQISDFKSIYSVRFYEMAIMHLKKSKYEKCKFILEIQEIRDRLEITKKYKRFFNFKARVLEPAKKEINNHSNIKFSYKVKKLGRSPHKIELTVSKMDKEQPTLPKYKPTNLSPAVFEKANQIVRDSGNRWDIYAIEQQFYEYMRKKGMPENIEGAFIGFVKKKVSTQP